jgi:hypothetical protein
MNYIITGNTYNSKYLEHPDAGIKVLSGTELESANIRFSAHDKVYVPSETSLSTVLQCLDDPVGVAGISRLKDKYLCREALQALYPDFYFSKCSLEEIPGLQLDKKIVIKPLKGFFGTGVRFADSSTDLTLLAAEIRKEVTANSRFFPESILTRNDFILEEFIAGEEYAVDMFFDALGKPDIMNIYHHPEPDIPEYAHLMYYSNKELFDKYLAVFTDFFTDFGNGLKLKNFPIHAEFKLQGERFVPIEFNPMRYGGFGLADLTYLSYGMQPIAAYFVDQPADWSKIWSSRASANYAFILAYNGKNADLSVMQPLHEAFQSYLREHAEIMDYVRLDHLHNPVFAIAYIKTEDLDSLKKLLKTEFNAFFA